LTAYIIGVLTLTAQEGEVVNHIFDGNQQAESKEFNEAEMAYRRALSKAPEKPEALYNLGNTHFEEQDFDEAKQRYFQTQKFTENKFSKQQAFHNLGNVFMKQKDYAKAVEAYKNALRNNPEDEETRYNYALAKELLKKEQDQQNQDQQDQQNEDEQENKDQNQDQNKEGDKDKDSGKDNDEEQGDEGDKDEDKKEEGDQKKENQPQQGDQEKEQPAQPRKTELSPEQVKSLLEAMSNQEKKVQDKVNAEKVQGIPVRGQKDW
jgi:tetratricopeptide (TPR) repeat protein